MRTLLAVGLLGVLACAEAPSVAGPADPAGPSLAPAVTNTSSTSVPFNLVVLVPCANGGAGELVDLNGELHILVSTTTNGNMTRLKTHFQPQGVSGTGLTTGDKYQATGVTQDEFTIRPGSTFEMTFVNNFRIIGQGPGNNFLVHENVHLTVNANGDVTATVDNFSIDCK